MSSVAHHFDGPTAPEPKPFERQTLQQGMHGNIPMQQYLSDPAPEPSLSRGGIKTLLKRTPLHCRNEHPRMGGNGGGNHSVGSDRGSVAHAIVLDQGDDIEVCDFKNWTTKAAKEAKAKARSNGRTPVLAHKLEAPRAMAEVVRPILAQFGPMLTEQTMIWHGETYWGRCRPDLVSDFMQRVAGPNVVIDYKTCEDADPASWVRRSLYPMGNDIQAAWNLRALAHIAPGVHFDFYWVVQEVEPPYAVSVIHAGQDLLDHADLKVCRGIKRWSQCIESKEWPGYPTDVMGELPSPEPPAYDVYDFLDRDIEVQK